VAKHGITSGATRHAYTKDIFKSVIKDSKSVFCRAYESFYFNLFPHFGVLSDPKDKDRATFYARADLEVVLQGLYPRIIAADVTATDPMLEIGRFYMPGQGAQAAEQEKEVYNNSNYVGVSTQNDQTTPYFFVGIDTTGHLGTNAMAFARTKPRTRQNTTPLSQPNHNSSPAS
jgi:hypothetical protein